MNIKRRALSLLLAIATLVSMMPANLIVFAAGEETTYTEISVEDMVVGKLYKATFYRDGSEEYNEFIPYKPSDIEGEENLLEWKGYNDNVSEDDAWVSKDNFPQDLTVQLVETGDVFVWVTNEDWPLEYNLYRYVSAEDVIITEMIEDETDVKGGEVELIHGSGNAAMQVVLSQGEKSYVFTELGDQISDTAKYQWQMQTSSGKWADIRDYVYPYAAISEALISNVSTASAKIRCVVTEGAEKYASSILYATWEEGASQATLSNVNANDAEFLEIVDLDQLSAAPSYSFSQLSSVTEETTEDPNAGIALAAETTVAEGDTTEGSAGSAEAFQITVQYVFMHNCPVDDDIHGMPVANGGIAITLGKGSSYTGTITFPPVSGYRPYIKTTQAEAVSGLDADSNEIAKEGYLIYKVTDPLASDPVDVVTYYLKATASIEYEEQIESDNVIVYYVPQEVNFVINIYEQNLQDDEYTLAQSIIATGIADSVVGEGLDAVRTGFSPLFYDADTQVMPDGSTVIDIYYDRNYYLVEFDIGDDAYGATPYYVRYNTQVMLPTPTNPGYSFTGWSLKTVDGKTQAETDSTVWNNYNVTTAGSLITVKNSLVYTTEWQKATTTYTIVYWLENIDDDNYTIDYFEVVDSEPGNVVSASDSMTREDKACFTYNDSMSTKNVTVKGDGTTAVNVYYDRNEYTLSFLGCSNTSWYHSHRGACVTSSTEYSTITRKYNSDISDIWPIQNTTDGTYFENGERWEPYDSDLYDEVLVFLPYMPSEDIIFFLDEADNTEFHLYYYVQALPEATYDTTYQNINFILKRAIDANYGYITESEDFVDLIGFKQYASDPTFDNNGRIYSYDTTDNNVYFYYERNQYNLVFNDGQKAVKTQTFYYEESIDVEGVNDFVPQIPSNKEEGSVKFAGWYTTSNCADGTEFDFTGKTMPLDGLVLYAKWEDCSYTAKVYNKGIVSNGVLTVDETDLLTEKTVVFGSFVEEPDYQGNGTTDIFAGWYYLDGIEEKRFDFNTMAFKKDYVIYAKWTSKVPVPYTVRYMLEGTDIEIADPTTGVSLANISKPFTAKAGNDLYEGYRYNYFPTQRATSILMQDIDGGNNYTFYYKKVEKITYTITHNFTSDDFVGIIGSDTLTLTKNVDLTGDISAVVMVGFRDGVTLEELKDNYDDTTAEDLWEVIIKLSPDSFQKKLVLVVDGDNAVTFNWAASGVTGYYQVVHYFQNLDGDKDNKSDYTARYTQEFVGTYEQYYTADYMTMAGFTKNTELSTDSGTLEKVTEGTDGGTLSGGLVLELYYVRSEYTYTVKHRYYNSDGTLAHESSSTGTAIYEQVVTASSVPKDGYYVTGSSEQSAKIVAEGQEIIFNYNASLVYYYYQVEPYANVIGGELSNFNETLGVNETPKGSTVTVYEGFVFDGWYLDGEKVSSELTITPKPTAADAGKTLTYVAKFLPTTRTFKNVNVADENQVFIYNIKGKDTANADIDLTFTITGNNSVVISMLKYGNYTITLLDWSWRYDSAPTVKFVNTPLTPTSDGASQWNIEIVAVGDITFDYSGVTVEDQWLTDDANVTQ